jgi:uncharacterized protein
MPVIEDVVASPCVRACTLDDDDVCLGCGRTLEEIKAWGGAGADGRRDIIAAAEKRKARKRPRLFKF